VISGLISGITQAGLLNPWDRALYLSVTDKRSFLHKLNFTAPYQGFTQTIFQKTISGGLYFTLQSAIDDFLTSKYYSDPSQKGFFYHILLGSSAGVLNGIILNQLSIIKYHAWSKGEGVSFIQSSKDLYVNGGVYPFFRGMLATGIRDMIFGISYELLRGWCRRTIVTRILKPPNEKDVLPSNESSDKKDMKIIEKNRYSTYIFFFL